MRLHRLMIAITVGGFVGLAALAQEPPAATEEPGLRDLGDTIRGLEDAPPESAARPAAEAPAPPPERPASTPRPSATPSPATPPRPAPPLTRAQVAELERIVRRGRQLIAIAQAGSVATRDMLTRISDPEGVGIVGWIAEPAGNAMTITFYGNGAAGPVAIYRGDVLGGRVTERQIHLGGDRPPLTPLQARMAAARAATDDLDNAACGGASFNVLVVPPASATESIDVYQITPETQEGRIPFGGHFRTTVAADGSVSASRGFSPNCLDLAVPAAPANQPPPPLAVTHVLDPMPTELHVFLAALARRPLLLATGEPQRIWLVTGERIAEVRERSATP